MTGIPSIGDYLISRLEKEGVGHVFGIPGDYVLGFYQKLVGSRLAVINTNDEQGAGFAADAYARMKGLGVVCVTYGVGGLKVVNTTAQAYAEKSPVLVISGAPGITEQHLHTMLHHKVSSYEDQIRIFERVTVASACLSDPSRAYAEIDRVISAVIESKRPGYLELPRDMVAALPPSPPAGAGSVPVRPFRDPGLLEEVLAESAERLNRAARPVILAGVEVSRYRLAGTIMALASRAGIPVASTILGKSAIDERDPLFMGIYAGAVGDERVREYVESSDCLLLIGVFPTDLDLGAYTARLDTKTIIAVSSEKTSVGYHVYEGTGFSILDGLSGALTVKHDAAGIPRAEKHEPLDCLALKPVPITTRQVFRIINAFIDETTVLIADAGDALFGSTEIEIPGPDRFVSPAYYASLGFAVPAGIGIKAALPGLRPLILVGDGSFQMTGMEVSTAARYHMDPIIVVLNNRGYGTERPMLDGPFNDVAEWHFAKIPHVIGTGKGYVVRTEEDLGTALLDARKYSGPSIIEILLEPGDISPELRRLTAKMKQKVG